jgi:hypothetical protein
VPLGICADVPPSQLVSNPIVKQLAFKDARPRGDNILDRWLARGEFDIALGQEIDPDTQALQIELGQNDGTRGLAVLYSATLDPAQCPGSVCFTPSTTSEGFERRWRFRLKRADPDIPGAPGWRSGVFKRSVAEPNRLKFSLKGAGTALLTPEPIDGIRRLRQNIKVGDDCVTVTLDCQPNPKGTRYRCGEALCGNGLPDRREGAVSHCGNRPAPPSLCTKQGTDPTPCLLARAAPGPWCPHGATDDKWKRLARQAMSSILLTSRKKVSAGILCWRAIPDHHPRHEGT